MEGNVTLFVDVDDTLIIYDLPPPNPYGYFQGTPWRVNQQLLDGFLSPKATLGRLPQE